MTSELSPLAPLPVGVAPYQEYAAWALRRRPPPQEHVGETICSSLRLRSQGARLTPRTNPEARLRAHRSALGLRTRHAGLTEPSETQIHR